VDIVDVARSGRILNCDICGRQIHGRPNRIVVEGARMMACEACTSLGTPYREPKMIPLTTIVHTPKPVPVAAPRPVPPKSGDRRAPREVQELEIADNYPQIIQKARRKHELSQEDLALKVKERLSVIRKIELGKMIPDMRLAKELEHVLRVKLLVLTSEPPVPKPSPGATKEVTLADVARIRNKEGKDTTELQT
jgi:putative transcription factor